MKNPSFSLFVPIPQGRFWLLVLLFCLVAAFAGTGFFPLDQKRSVEFGLAETSPAGIQGGYAIPASGGSNGVITHACDSSSTIAITISISPRPNNSSIDINGQWYGSVGYASQGSAISVTNTSPAGPGSPSRVTSVFVFPADHNYDVTVTGQYGTGGMDNPIQYFSYTADIGPVDCDTAIDGPGVDLKVRNNTTGSGWVDGPITINTTDDLDLSWTSNNVVSCAGSQFSVPGNAVSGTQTTVSNPGAGSTRTYTIVCGSDSSGAVSDSVRVTAIAGTGQPPTLTGDPIYILKGGNTNLTWNTNGNDPASCTLTGPGVNLSPVSGNTGTHTVTVYGESTYTIQCPGGSDSVTIHVLPVIQET